MHAALEPDGFLILGPSEQAAMPELWHPVLEGNTCHYQLR
jgi:chemotaxis methyl-accepting protein methylase